MMFPICAPSSTWQAPNQRVLASRLARTIATERLLGGSLLVATAGLPVLLAAGDATAAVAGIILTGIGVGALFPLTSSLHVGISAVNADRAVGQVLGVVSIGQILGPLMVGAIAEAAGVRTGLLFVPVFVLRTGVALARYQRNVSAVGRPLDALTSCCEG